MFRDRSFLPGRGRCVSLGSPYKKLCPPLSVGVKNEAHPIVNEVEYMAPLS